MTEPSTTTSRIEVELESAVGPRVLVWGEADHAEVDAELPVGWTVEKDDWQNGVRTDSGAIAYPLSGPWYTVHEDESGVEHTFRADLEAKAEELAEEWLADGDNHLDSTDETIWVRGRLRLLGADVNDSTRIKARVDPPAPPCADRSREHDWSSPHSVLGVPD